MRAQSRPLRQPPSGLDSLDVRRRYLRRRHGGPSLRALSALWFTFAAVVSWLFFAGFAGLAH